MTPIPGVAIVILNWNGKSFLEKFLPSVMASAYGRLQVYVADNASSDDSLPFLRQHYPSVKIIINTANDGFAKGYNTALQHVSADYYILLNSDVEVTPGWIEPVIALMETDKKIAACQPKILSYSNKNYFEYAGASGGFIDKLGYPFARGRIFETCEKDEAQYNDTKQIFWATGAALFIRAQAFHEVNGFDEHFFAHQEEIDLCWRLQRNSYTVYVVPASVVYHVGGGTLPMGTRRKVFFNFRNNLIMMSKNLPLAEACRKIPLRIFLDAIAAYRFLISGDFSTFISIANAHLHYAKWIAFGKRTDKMSAIKTKNFSTIYPESIAWQYFIKRKKHFQKLLQQKMIFNCKHLFLPSKF